MNYYPFHIGDYLSATRHLSWEEDAAYRRLLDTYYTTEKPLPADLRACCRLVMATTESQREAVRVVLEEFFQATEIGWVNLRADREIDAMREKQQKQRDRVNKRWDKVRSERGTSGVSPENVTGIATVEKKDTTVQKNDPDVIPPTPTPTPTPTPIKNTKNTAPLCVAPPDGVSISVWRDFEKLRKTKKAPLTETCMAGIRQEAEKAGWPLETVLQECCTRGWQSFKAVWVIERRMSAETFAERDDRNAKERYERLTGRKHPDLLPQHLNIIEAEPIVRIAA